MVIYPFLNKKIYNYNIHLPEATGFLAKKVNTIKGLLRNKA